MRGLSTRTLNKCVFWPQVRPDSETNSFMALYNMAIWPSGRRLISLLSVWRNQSNAVSLLSLRTKTPASVQGATLHTLFLFVHHWTPGGMDYSEWVLSHQRAACARFAPWEMHSCLAWVRALSVAYLYPKVKLSSLSPAKIHPLFL